MSGASEVDLVNHKASCRFCLTSNCKALFFQLDKEISKKFFDFTKMEVNNGKKLFLSQKLTFSDLLASSVAGIFATSL